MLAQEGCVPNAQMNRSHFLSFLCYSEETHLLLKVVTTMSVLGGCPGAPSATGVVNVSLKAPGFAILPAVRPVRHPGEHVPHQQESRWDRGKERKTKAIDINDPLAARGPKVWRSERPARYQLIAGGRGIRLYSD